MEREGLPNDLKIRERKKQKDKIDNSSLTRLPGEESTGKEEETRGGGRKEQLKKRETPPP